MYEPYSTSTAVKYGANREVHGTNTNPPVQRWITYEYEYKWRSTVNPTVQVRMPQNKYECHKTSTNATKQVRMQSTIHSQTSTKWHTVTSRPTLTDWPRDHITTDTEQPSETKMLLQAKTAYDADISKKEVIRCHLPSCTSFLKRMCGPFTCGWSTVYIHLHIENIICIIIFISNW